MTKLLDKAIATLQDLPERQQDEIARMLLSIAGQDTDHLVLDDRELQSMSLSLAQATKGEFATDDALAAVWKRHAL